MAKEKKPKLTREEKKELKRQQKEEKKRIKEEKKRAKKEGREYIPPEKEGEEDENAGGTLIVVIVGFLIFLVWLAILAFLVKMDVGGFGSTVAYPLLKDVPVVKMILPEVEEVEVKEYAEEDAAYQFASMEEAVARIKELEAQLAEAQKTSGENDAHVADLETQVAELAAYKANEAAFEQQKEKFYEEVVFSDDAPDINTYKEYYESIEPENAEKIYQKVIEKQQADAKIKEYADTYSSMKPAAAAGIFNTMTDNLDLVAKILGSMTVEDRSNILSAMDTETAAQLTKIMEP